MPDIITRSVDAAAVHVLTASGIEPRLARLYAARGVTAPEQMRTYLDAMLAPQGLSHISDAAMLLADAIQANEKLLIVADYDALLHNLRNHLVQDQQYHPDNTPLFSENSGASYLANTRWDFSSSAAQARASDGDFALL